MHASKSVVAGLVVAFSAASMTLLPAVANASPADVNCGASWDSWTYVRLEGTQQTYFVIDPNKTSDWIITGIGGAHGADVVWISGNSAQFNTELGQEHGQM